MNLSHAQVEIHALDGVQAAVDLAALHDLKQRRSGTVLRLHRVHPCLSPRAGDGSSTRQLRPLETASTRAPTTRTRRDPVDAPVDATMQALRRFPVGIKPRDETVGSRRRPGLLDAKLLDAADLRRLAIIEPAVEGRAYPEIGRHRLHHRFAELALAQHEFGQLRAHAEEGHPVFAAPRHERCGRDSQRSS